MHIEPPNIAVVIVNYRSSRDVVGLLELLRRAKGRVEKNIFIIDSASGDDSKDYIPPRLKEGEYFFEAPENLGYGACNNIGIRKGMEWGADYFLILNPDVVVEADFLSPLLIALEARNECGIASSVSLSPGGNEIQSVGGRYSLFTGRAKRRLAGKSLAALRSDFDYVDFPEGNVMLLKREFLEDAGLFREDFFLYYEDVELGLRAGKEYWKTAVVYQSKVRHKDTTRERYFDPVTNYVGVRNQIWVERIYAGRTQYLVFFIVSLWLRWPWRFVRNLCTLHFRSAFMVLKGIWHGLFGKSVKCSAAHLALPLAKRKAALKASKRSSVERVSQWIQPEDVYLIAKSRMSQINRKRNG
jgi:GT2 family glycosyltransferase